MRSIIQQGSSGMVATKRLFVTFSSNAFAGGMEVIHASKMQTKFVT